MKNIFEESVNNEVVERINKLTDNSNSVWGKMSVSQMLAHCNVTYEMAFDEINEIKPKGIKKWLLTKFVKPTVVGDKPYSKNGRTAPSFIKEGKYEFNIEKLRLIDYLNKYKIHQLILYQKRLPQHNYR